MHKIFSAALLAVALLGASAGPTAAERAAAKHAFGPLLPKLAKSSVPVLLPASLPGPDLINAIPQIQFADNKGYDIELGLVADCNGVACHIGSISGMPVNRLAITGEKITIPLGVTAYFVKGDCGASCSDSTITFDLHGYRYQFAEKGASKGSMREFVNTIVTPAQLKAE
jgi:hypothetical protein